jgi:hypothetical protein
VPTLRALVASATLLATPAAWCADEGAPPAFTAPWWGPEAAVLTVGTFGLRAPRQPNALLAGLEIRGGPFFWELRLMSGVLAAADGSAYVYLGVLMDFPANELIHFVVSFSPGLYHAGFDHNLGLPLIFRSAGEIAFAVTASTRVGVSFSHMSNGTLAKPNGGVETLSLTLTFLTTPY